MSDLIAPLKKAQRKSEGGQLFPGSVFPLRATPFPKTPQNPPTPLFFKGVSVILLFHGIFSTRIIYRLCEGSGATKQTPGREAKKYVILNDSEESHRRTDEAYTSHFGRGIFRYAQYDVLFYLSLRGKRSDEANSREGGGLRSICSILFQGDCHGTSCLAMTN